MHFRYGGEIQVKKYSKEVAWKRFKNILVPLCELAEVTHSIGPESDGISLAYHYGSIEKLYRQLGRIWKYPMLPGKRGYVTVTIRKSFRNQHRNSGPEWREFIAEMSQKKTVIVLEDCEETPIPIKERMRLYANADMNYGTNGGPLVLCHLSEAPYKTYNMGGNDIDTQHLIKTGFPPQSQFSFRNERQELIWETGRELIMTELGRSSA